MVDEIASKSACSNLKRSSTGRPTGEAATNESEMSNGVDYAPVLCIYTLYLKSQWTLRQEFRLRDLPTRSVRLFPTRAQVIRDIKNITLDPGPNQIAQICREDGEGVEIPRGADSGGCRPEQMQVPVGDMAANQPFHRGADALAGTLDSCPGFGLLGARVEKRRVTSAPNRPSRQSSAKPPYTPYHNMQRQRQRRRQDWSLDRDSARPRRRQTQHL
ncbi:hypothetical protein JHW43_009546 [Diplocarpon mali]|nr:hypothetical protein JHW43_009546 [Diplocarpon mali]